MALNYAYLYIDNKGREVRRHSFSSGDTFEFCAQKYKLSRIDGYTERGKKASLLFGKAVEAAIQFHHANECAGGIDEFARLWEKQREVTDLIYTKREGSWADLLRMGREMLTLYALRLPSLPIGNPRFQLNLMKELFPGTHLAGITFTAWIDMLSLAPHDHPLLPVLPGADRSGERQVVIDIKTAAASLDDRPGMVGLDQQLRAYAWVTGIQDVAFLVLVKGGAVESGEYATLLEDTGEQRVYVDDILDEDATALVVDAAVAEEFRAAVKGKREKKRAEARASFGTEHPGTFSVKALELLTKVKLQFLAARISMDDMRESGQAIGQQVASIVMSRERGFFPKQGGIRFPNAKCTFCPMRGNCLGDGQLQDSLVVKSDEQWLEGDVN